MTFTLFVTCPKGIEALLEEELMEFGITTAKQTVGGLQCQASLSVIYKICLWSRLANRVLLFLFTGVVEDSKQIYQLCHEYDWAALFEENTTLAIHFSGQSAEIRNEMYGAQCVKDAVVDKLRETTGTRPNINPTAADCNVLARLYNGQLNLYYDLSGQSLHQRGYRQQGGAAPLKENLAAALLYRSGWKKIAALGKPLIDPCCGSGTLLIEAAMIATNKAPGLQRETFGFLFWRQHDAASWEMEKQQALQEYQTCTSAIVGFDADDRVLRIAKNNIEMAGFLDLIQVEKRAFKDFKLPNELQTKPGLLIANPPYGERLNDVSDVIPLYQQLGLALTQHCQGWQAAIFTADKILAKATGLRSNKQYAFFNGSIPCKLYLFDISPENKSSITSIPPRAEMIFNRLKKNSKNLKSWRKQNDIHCYRVYDADIPEYAFAIDIYQDWAHVQEYAAPSEIPLEKTEKRLLDVMQALPLALEIPRQQVVLKQRKKQKGKQQYEKQAETEQRLLVTEGKAKFIVNCKDYLDTGLFLDHRLLRRKFFEIAKNKDFLNLFCYTATASVHAALGGAKETVNVDMSNTYLDWAKENFSENEIELRKHYFIQADCLQWIEECKTKFDIIFLDPPSFSNSKRMQETLDIQRDHEELIEKTMQLLKPAGQLYFSTNFRKFKLNPSIAEKFSVKDISPETIDKDYARNPHIHRCFLIEHKE